MATLLRDLRFALRMYRRNLVFFILAVSVVAIGIGANTAIFTVINGVLLRPLPYANADRLVWIWGEWPGGEQGSVSPPDLIDYRERSRTLERLGAYANQSIPFNLAGGGEPEQVSGYFVTANFFEVLGVAPESGRGFLPAEEEAGNDRVVVISYGLWQRSYGGADIVGSFTEINGEEYLVAGIMPPSVDLPRGAELWAPLPVYLPEMQLRYAHSLRPIGRMQADVTVEQAQAELDLIAAQLEEEYPDTNSGWSLKLVPLREQVVGGVSGALWLLYGATIFVLLIAWANVGNLQLVQATARQREIAVRTALSESRFHLIRQLCTESALLALVAGALGFALAQWGTRVLIALTPQEIPRLTEIRVDGSVLGVALLLTLVAAMLFGLVPALQLWRGDILDALKEAGRSTGEGRRRGRLRNGLVVLEVALAFILVIGAGLMIHSFFRLLKIDPGFAPERVLTMQVSLPIAKYGDPMRRADFFLGALEGIGSLPGVEAVGMISELPLSGESHDTYFAVEGDEMADPSQRSVANIRIVGGEYFTAMGVPLVQGRFFSREEDFGAPVVILNEAMAKSYFPDRSAVGRFLIIDVGEPFRAEIVGVVGDVRQFSLDVEPFDEMYLPMVMSPSTNLVVGTTVDPLSLAPAIGGEIRTLDRGQPVTNIRSMEQVIARSVVEPRFRMILLSVFACMALVLAVAGVYGVISYVVVLRTQEIGIRMAMGAGRSEVIAAVVGGGMRLTLLGLGLGLVGALVLTRLVSGFLVEVPTPEWITYSSTALLLGLVGLLACYLPARRAAKIDPIAVMHHE